MSTSRYLLGYLLFFILKKSGARVKYVDRECYCQTCFRLFAPVKRRLQHDSKELRIRELEAARARDLERLRQLEEEKDDALTR